MTQMTKRIHGFMLKSEHKSEPANCISQQSQKFDKHNIQPIKLNLFCSEIHVNNCNLTSQ